MTKEILGTLVTLLSLGVAVGGGIWTFSKLDSRVEALERDQAWKSSVDARLDVNERRWAKHFDLWGAEIQAKAREVGVAAGELP